VPELIDLAALQDRLLSIFVRGNDRTVRLASGDAPIDLREVLDRALRRKVTLPEGIDLRFDHIQQLFPTVRGVLETWKEGIDDIVHIFAARGDAKQLEQAWKDLWSRDDWKRALEAIRQFGAHQALLGVSFLTTLRHFTDVEGLATAIAEGYQRYFFDKEGFSTLDGISVRQPSTPTLGLQDEKEMTKLKEFFGLQTAERYLRDLLRIAVELAGDRQYQLARRLQRLEGDANLNQETLALAKSWFAGFSSMSEGLVMSSVEQMTQGVSSFSANPLVAAAASTLAAIAARKATQHAFLWQLGIKTE